MTPPPPTAPLPDPATPDTRAAALRRMQRLALGLLAAAAALYVLARILEPRHPGWGYLAAFSEAAMVGAVADWFAVVALFRHPLGLPIPHTAIIPNNKSRIGRQLSAFVVHNFLQTDSVLERLRRYGPADRLAAWLAEPRHAQGLAQRACSALRHLLDAFDDARVRDFLRDAVQRRLRRIDTAPLAGRLLDLLTAQRRHQALLDGVLRQLSQVLGDEVVHAKIAEVIAQEVRYLRLVGLDNAAGRLAATKLAAGIGRLIGEMGEDPDHPLRLRFDEAVADFVQRLQHDPALQARADAWRDELLQHPALLSLLHGLWDELLAWLRADLERADASVLAARLAALLQSFGARLQREAPLRQWLDEQLLHAAPRWIERYREDIGRTIVERIEAWDTAELTAELERHIGRDLQFVRINGTLVGGLVGLVLYTLTQWARG